MIDLYTWNTPNGQKPLILLEELGIAYRIRPIDIGAGDQKEDDYLAINPNGRIPAMVDARGGAPMRVFESGAILVHLCEQAGAAGEVLLPRAAAARAEVLAWCFWQVGGPGPMVGQWHHFAEGREERVEVAIERYRDESIRLMQVFERGLAGRSFIAGDGYTIADLINWTWFRFALDEAKSAGVELPELRRLRGWVERVGSRPAVQRAMAVAEGIEAQGDG